MVSRPYPYANADVFHGVDCEGLNSLIQAWELAHVEFKSRLFVEPLDEDRRKELAAALASLANRGGGYLII